MNQTSTQSDSMDPRLGQYLDGALASLGAGERDAVLLRYFQGLSMKEAGAALGITEDTAAKRVSRGLERLRHFFQGKGLSISAAALVGGLAAQAAQAAPAGLAASVSGGVTAALATGGASAAAGGVVAHQILTAQQVMQAMAWAKAVKIGGGITAAIAAAVAGAAAWQFIPSRKPVAPTPTPVVAANVPAALDGDQVRQGWGPEWAGIPIAKGWPVAMPGHATGTPAVGDLDGDGDLEVIVPSMHRNGVTRHPQPTIAATLYAFHHDGKPVKGWPVVLLDEQGRQRDRQVRPGYADNWAASPSIADLDGDGRDEVIITSQAMPVPGAGRGYDATHILNGDGTRRIFPDGLSGGEVWSSMPIVDVNGDGKLDLICRNIAVSADGKPIPGWAPAKAMNGFAPCVGDANGDGKPEVYYCSFMPEGLLYGFDCTGRVIPGWPQETTRQCLYPPVMGDVDGDGKMEIFSLDQGGHLMAWQWHGRALIPGYSAEGMKGVFKDGIQSFGGSPTLADLDGDRRPEIIVFDQRTQSLKAWHGDGKGLFSADGTVVHLPEVVDWGGVTVGDLGGDGMMDLFVGVFWVQLAKDGSTTVKRMLPRSQATDGGCIITDVDKDGKTDLVFGLTDGQVFIYSSGKDYKESWMQWPTPNGGQRHTGVWRRPGK